MATGGQKESGYNLVNVGTLTLKRAALDPWGIVVDREMLMITDWNEVLVYRRHDGKLLSTLQLEARPWGICCVNDREICIALLDGTIKIMSVEDTGVITRDTISNLKTPLDRCYGVGKFMDKVVVSGVKQDTVCWCVVSRDGHVDAVHNICKGSDWSFLTTTKTNMVYILCPKSRCVCGYNILNPRQQPFTYKCDRPWSLRGITVDDNGYLFVCDSIGSIHHLTDQCRLVTKYMKGIPSHPMVIFWDHGILYVSSYGRNKITLFKPEYPHQQGEDGGLRKSSLFSRWKRYLGFGHSKKKLPNRHSQADHKVSEVLVSDERKQPVTEETSSAIEQGDVFKGHSSAETQMLPTVQVYEESEDDKQGPVIPVEILRMDDKSIQLYKEALQDGKEKVYNIRVMVVGQYGVGKTTLTKRLLGQEIDISERKSTEGIDVFKHCCKISLETGKWIVQPKDADELSRIHRFMKLLTDRAESAKVSLEKEGHVEVIYQIETILEEDIIDPVHHGDENSDDDNILSSSESDIVQEGDITSMAPEEFSVVTADQRHVDVESSSSAVVEREGHAPSKETDPMMEFLQLLNEKADKLEKSIVEYAALGIWDFAGQYAFYTTHQTFLTYRAIYLLVTDLTQQFTDLVNNDECYFDSQGARLCQVHDLVEVWLNSIHSCAQLPAAGTPVTSAAGIIAASPAADIIVTSPAALSAMTSSADGITETSVSGTAVTSHVARIPVTLPAASIPVASLAAGIPVTSTAAGIVVTPPAAGTSVTSPAPCIPVTSPAASIQLTSFPFGTLATSPTAGNPVTLPEVGITVTSPVVHTPSTTAGTPVTSHAVGTSVMSCAAGIIVTSPGVDIPATPPVILVGTHVDKMQEGRRQEVINNYFSQICFILKDKPTLQHLVDFFAIDNTHFDPQLETLKKRIFDLAKVQPYWGEEVPANWLPLEEALMKLKASGIKVIPLHLVEELNQKGSIPIKTAEQLDLFLRFQHDTGNILYFSSEGLRKSIVLDPQWLIDAQKSLITAETFILKNNPSVRSKWFEFKENGKLTPELIVVYFLIYIKSLGCFIT